MKNKNIRQTKNTGSGTPLHRSITAGLIVLTLWQGGFTDLAWCLGGVFFALLLIIKPAKIPPRRYKIAALTLAASYLISVFANGATFDGWMGFGKIVTVILFALLPEKPKPERIAVTAGLIVAVLGITAYSQWYTFPWMVGAGRIFGVFQYANAAGIFLAVCAFITRLSKKHECATVMEVALLLTQSAGAMAVYALGWLAYWAYNRKYDMSFCLCSFILSAIITAATFAIARYTPVPQLAPAILIGYITGKQRVSAAVQKISERNRVTAAACITVAVLIAGLFYLRGIQPLLTYIERIIQITDGAKVMMQHPFGIGPGNWTHQVAQHQSAAYSARLIHSGFIQIGVDGGVLALLGVVALIILWVRGSKKDKYFIAAMMILAHALLDFTASYLSIIMLLIIMMQAEAPAEDKTLSKQDKSVYKNIFRASMAVPVIFLSVLIIPETVKNRALWEAGAGQHKAALETLGSGVILKGDSEASIMKMSYALAVDDFEALDSAFEAVPRPGEEAYRYKAQSLLKRGEFEAAAQYALNCIEKSPYRDEGYILLEEILPQLPDSLQAEFRHKAEAIREEANQNAHIFAKYINDEKIE